jgi:hypothetical protein
MKRTLLSLIGVSSASYWTNGNDCSKTLVNWPANQSYPIMYTIGDATNTNTSGEMPDAYWFEYPTSELNVLSTSTAEVASTANTNE